MTDTTHDPALRMALRSLLADLTYPAALRSPWIADHLKEDAPPWTQEARGQLTMQAARWAGTQGASASAAIRKSLGIAVPEESTAPDVYRARTQTALDKNMEKAMTTETPTETPTQELYGDPDWSELERQAALLLQPPWEYAKDRVTKAVAAIKTGHVTLGTPASSMAHVTSEDGQRQYTVRENGCTCRATHPCYHMAAAELVRLVEGKKPQPSLFPQPPTVEERLAVPAMAQEEIVPMATDVLPVSAPEVLVIPAPRPPRPTLPEALSLRSITAIIADLSRPLPPACVATKDAKTKSGKTTEIRYLHWQTTARLLDMYAPGWNGEVTRLEQHGDMLRVTYRLHIPCAEGMAWREATGEDDEWGEDEETRYGNPSANAQANAFKRAAALFGCGQWLYDKPGDTTAKALADHFKQEKVQAISELGKVLVSKGMARKEVFEWLKTQTGVTTTDDIPFASIRTILAYVAQQDEHECVSA